MWLKSLETMTLIGLRSSDGDLNGRQYTAAGAGC